MAVAYYVEKHNISPGEEFIAHYAQNRWSIPEMSSTEAKKCLVSVNSARPARHRDEGDARPPPAPS